MARLELSDADVEFEVRHITVVRDQREAVCQESRYHVHTSHLVSGQDPSMEKSEGRGFTIQHPLRTILIFSIPLLVFEFVGSFVFFTAPNGGKWDTLFNRVIPLLWGVASLCVLVRSLLWRLTR